MKYHIPLTEVFGYPATDMSQNAVRCRNNRLCPFGNKIPNCTKDKAQSPLGVCSINHENMTVITCPIRFRQNWLIAEDAAGFFFPKKSYWTTLTEVRLKDADGLSAGNIDVVVCAYDHSGRIQDFGALEIQAVYISGNVRNPFEEYMAAPKKFLANHWDHEGFPRPDYLSSSRKRLAPQLLFKGGILNSWGKKMAVAIHKGFFETLPNLPEVPQSQADIAWMIYDIKPTTRHGETNQLHLTKIVYSKFDAALTHITRPKVGNMDDFVKILQEKFDKTSKVPPCNQIIKPPF